MCCASRQTPTPCLEDCPDTPKAVPDSAGPAVCSAELPDIAPTKQVEGTLAHRGRPSTQRTPQTSLLELPAEVCLALGVRVPGVERGFRTAGLCTTEGVLCLRNLMRSKCEARNSI